MDFAKLLAKIDSIESTKQLNESGAKPDFLDLDKDGNRTEPMKQAAKDAEAKKSDDKDEDKKLDEVSAPGQEEWIKKNKKRFIDQYGKKKGMEVLYATAWKRSKKVEEARQLEECYGQAIQGMGGQMNDRSGMSVSSSLDTRTGTKTLSVSAEGDAADQLAQLLKLSGMMTPAGNMSSGEVELEEYANEPNPEVQGIETQLQQGNDLNRPKKMTPHGYRNGDNPLAMDVREQAELDALSRALSEELEGIKVDKSKVPAYKRKQQGGDWKTTQQDLERERERNISGAEGLAALKKKQGLKEQALKPLSVEQLATISDEALDNAYHYGRSTPGGSFGWQANLMSAAYAKKMIEAGITDIEKISDAIHKGWNVTAQKFVQNPDQFTDTEKLRAAGKLDAKLQQREKLMRINYAQLPEDEKEKDRVVARALLAALTGQQQGVAEAKADPTSTWVVFYTAERKSYDEKPSSVTDEETIVAASSKEEAIAKVKKMSKVGTNMYGFSARPARKSDGLDSDDIAEQRVTEGSAHGFNVVRYYEKTGNQLKIVNWLRKEAGLPKNAPVYFDDADLVYDDKTIVPNALVNPNLKLNDLLTAVIQASGTGRQGKQNVGGIYRESNVEEGFNNTYNVGDRVDSPLGAGTIVAVSKNVNVDGRVKVKLDDPSKAGEDGRHKDSFVLNTTQLKHIDEQGVAEGKQHLAELKVSEVNGVEKIFADTPQLIPIWNKYKHLDTGGGENVIKNIRQAFPSMSDKEVKELAYEFHADHDPWYRGGYGAVEAAFTIKRHLEQQKQQTAQAPQRANQIMRQAQQNLGSMYEQGVAEDLNEMDKTQTSPGRDGDIDWTKKQKHLGPRNIIKAKDITAHGLNALEKTIKKREDKKKSGVKEGEIAQDPVADFLSKGGRVQQLPTKKPRKSEKTDYSSTHIGKGVPGKRNDSMGRAANVNRGGKPVVGL